jgi:hypothetical protein
LHFVPLQDEAKHQLRRGIQTMVVACSILHSQRFDFLVVEVISAVVEADPEPETFCTEGQCLTIDQQIPYLQCSSSQLKVK